MKYLILLVALLVSSHAALAEGVASPDGRISVTVEVAEGRPQWQASFAGKPLLERGALGLELAQDDFRAPFIIENVQRANGDTTWKPVWGNLSEVRDRYNELTLTLREAQGTRKFQIVFRAYDEGLALRYLIPAQANWPRATIKRRLTEYRFAADYPIYQNRNYEYGTKTIATMSRSEGAVTVDAGDNRFVALTDADRAGISTPLGFSEMAYSASKEKPNTIVVGLRSQAEGALPFASSWEAVIVGEGAAKLYENRHLIENLNPPNAIADTSWIRAGAAICQVRNTRMVTEELKKLMDFASAHNMAHVEIDHSWNGAETKWTPQEIEFFDKNKSKFWNDKPEWKNNVGGNPMQEAKGWVPFRPKADSGGNFVDLNVAELAAYGRKLNPPVGVCLYLRGAVLKEFGGEHPAEDVLKTYEKWGTSGIKLGFVPSGSQYNERTIAELVKIAAAHKLIVVIHDSYFPNGLSRTYPNLVNVEGVAGEEAEHSIPQETKSLHDIMLPFTRCLMGPVDYTPEFYKKVSKTHAHQVAMLVVYHGRPSMRGGMRQWSPGGEGGAEIDFVKKLPALFDEMKVFTDLGKWVTVARRRGDVWFVGTMGDGQERKANLPLSFLNPNTKYQATIYADTPGQKRVAVSQSEVTSQSIVPIAMEPDGGHLMLIEPIKP